MLHDFHYQKAVAAQNACNLSGIAHTLSQVITEVWKEARVKGEGTDWVNKHPIVTLYVGKMTKLNGLTIWNTDHYLEAYRICVERSHVEEPKS